MTVKIVGLFCFVVICFGFVSARGLDVIFEWKELDFEFPDPRERENAIRDGSFIANNNVPVGLEVWKNKLFITVPRWRNGVAASLAYVFLNETDRSPKLIPYPNWESHNTFPINPRFGGLSGISASTRIVSPFRIRADACDRLWILDTGKSNILNVEERIGPNQLLVFDLTNDNLLLQYEIPRDFMNKDSFFANIAIEIKNNDCSNAFAYMADLGASTMIVYSLKKHHAWRVTHKHFFSEPKARNYSVAGVEFYWTDGLFGLALSEAENKTDNYRTMFFHPFSSFSEFKVSTRILQNETLWTSPELQGKANDQFALLGHREDNTQSSASFLDEKTGVLFYTQVTRDAVGCWNTRHSYNKMTQGQVAVDNVTMVFPNDLKIDSERNLWVLTDRMPLFLNKSMNHSDFNFRILSAPVDRVIKDTVCATGSSGMPTSLGILLIFLINSVIRIVVQ